MKKITTNISKEIILYSTIGNKITMDKKDAKVPGGIILIYPANDNDTKKLANFIICYMNYRFSSNSFTISNKTNLLICSCFNRHRVIFNLK